MQRKQNQQVNQLGFMMWWFFRTWILAVSTCFFAATADDVCIVGTSKSSSVRSITPIDTPVLLAGCRSVTGKKPLIAGGLEEAVGKQQLELEA